MIPVKNRISIITNIIKQWILFCFDLPGAAACAAGAIAIGMKEGFSNISGLSFFLSYFLHIINAQKTESFSKQIVNQTYDSSVISIPVKENNSENILFFRGDVNSKGFSL